MAAPIYYEDQDLKFKRPVGSDWPLPVIDVFHLRTHDGTTFIGGHLWGDIIAADGYADLLITISPDNSPHLLYNVSVGRDSELQFFTNVTASNVGSLAIIRNRAYYSMVESNIALHHDPVITDLGDPYPAEYIPGGSGGNAAGGVVGGFGEFVPGPGTHLIRITNIGGQTMRASITLHWYQHTPRPTV